VVRVEDAGALAVGQVAELNRFTVYGRATRAWVYIVVGWSRPIESGPVGLVEDEPSVSRLNPGQCV
jgi:hypothetical protein